MDNKRPLSDIPRNWLTIAAVVGGIIGITLTQTFHWASIESFIYTLGIAAACVALTVIGYRALRR